ncbi:MAG TPA: GAF domain-containing protein, partial [Gaiellaceae bacterium]|nr:GAF domain-containing protein [Gaiellaceae bacterium]
MTDPDPQERHLRYGPASKSATASYTFAVVATLAAFLTMLALIPLTDDAPSYVLLVAAVALTVWYGGFMAGALAVVVGWSLAFAVFVGEKTFDVSSEGELVGWGVALVVALGVVWVSFAMRRGHERAASAAGVAEASFEEMESLQQLASALSAALTPADVTHSLVERTPAILGAKGGAVGFVEDGELVIADPVGVAAQTHPPGLRLPLSALAPITRAIALGTPVVVRDRATFEAEYPNGASLTRYAQGAIAVPLRVAGEIVGSMSFLFDRPDAMSDDAEAIAQIAADLGGQALERAQLYELERQSRQALDRVLQIAPRFHAETVEQVVFEICRGARTTFGSDFGILWRVEGGRLELVGADPSLESLQPGIVAMLDDFPRLREAIGRLEVSFVPDVQETSRGAGLELVRTLGIHSSLRTPIAIGDEPGLLLVVSWQRVVSEPDPSTIVLARRYADQAGLAFEQLERRRAEAEAALRADETRRLQEITAALSQAATATDVSTLCLEHALEAVGADAGLVVLARPEGVTVELVASSGYSDSALEIWRGFDLDADVPFTRAIATGEPIWASTPEDVAAFARAEELGDASWATLPLRTGAGVRGALHLAFRSPRELSEAERKWLQTVVSQCAQALERSRLFDDEQLL